MTSFANVAGITDAEGETLAALLAQIDAHRLRNLLHDVYYRGQDRVRDLGIAVPPGLASVQTAVGWPTLAVDAIEERLDIEGWVLPGSSVEDYGVDELWRSNALGVESGPAHTDALIYGLNFVAVSTGDTAAGEPDPLITVEPPTRMTGRWNARTRRMDAAASRVWDPINQRDAAATLYGENVNVVLDRSEGRWRVRDRVEHGLGRVPVVRLVNKPRSGRAWGTSAISRSIVGYTDAAVRTILGMEIAREFYSSPQRYALNVDEKAFVDADGNPKTAWEVYLGRFLAISADPESGQTPSIGQLEAGSPAPYLDQIRGLASLVAAEIGCPTSYMGFNTDNPPSGDGMRMMEARLVKSVERRQTVFGAAWPEVIRLAVQMRDGNGAAAALGRLECMWRDASTPTKAASADAAVKLVAAGVLPANSSVTYEMLGFSATTQARLTAENRRARLDDTLRSLTTAPETAPA